MQEPTSSEERLVVTRYTLKIMHNSGMHGITLHSFKAFIITLYGLDGSLMLYGE